MKAALAHPGGAGKSDHQIAKHVGVADSTVGDWRKKLNPSIGNLEIAERTVTRGGSTYQQNTANIGRKPAEIRMCAERRATAHRLKGDLKNLKLQWPVECLGGLWKFHTVKGARMLEQCELPRTERYLFSEVPGAEECAVDFRLIYQGRLPAEGRSDTRVGG